MTDVGAETPEKQNPPQNEAPVISSKDIELKVGDKFDSKKGISAYDTEDENLTQFIKVTKNTVNTSKVRIYKVVYEVSDSDGNTTVKEIKVRVREKEIPLFQDAKNHWAEAQILK